MLCRYLGDRMLKSCPFVKLPPLVLLLSMATIGACFAEDSAPDKSAYTLFNRTPRAQLRDLTTDRPDVTESPYTVDAGWFQVEADFFLSTHDREQQDGSDISTNTASFSALNIKVGLFSNIDLQTIIEPRVRVKSYDYRTGIGVRNSSMGDVISRLKINFWGNDSGESALGLMPFVKWPTSHHGVGNDAVEGGIILPFARKLAERWDIGAMTEVDIVRNDADDGYTHEWTNSITLGHELPQNFGSSLEVASTLRRGAGLASLDVGLTYAIGKNFQLDLGCNIGLTRATDDLTFFCGWSGRF
jgi:hypothetical protein